MKLKLLEKPTEADRYLTLMRIGRSQLNPKDVNLWCQFSGGVAFFDIHVPNWELGFDFFDTFESYCIKYLKAHYFQREDDNVELKLLYTYLHLSEKIEKWKERKLKDEPGIRPAPTVLCNVCKYRINFESCKAFPDGIPNPWRHEPLHLTPYSVPKQKKEISKQLNDITFELGEAGSRCAKIEPLVSLRILSSRFIAPETMVVYNKIRAGLLEEEYNDNPVQQTL
jgi:hypothetical protein